MIIILAFIVNINYALDLTRAEPVGIKAFQNDTNKLAQTRRILGGRQVDDTRPYMVYLRPAPAADAQAREPNWLCSGVIIHERYILTSAACIEDIKQFLVVSGTHRWVPHTATDDDCVNNGAKKAIWKCVPKSYFFDGNEFDNMRWMADDIAVVKVEDDFNFQRRIKGCDFIPKKVAFNNQSADLEKPRTVASVAGWGSTDAFVDPSRDQDRTRAVDNSPALLETEVVLISKKACKRRWDPRYHYIIDGSMICSKDAQNIGASDKQSDSDGPCKDLVDTEDLDYAEDNEQNPSRKRLKDIHVHSAVHVSDTRRAKVVSGGFCENDHGGPLVVGQGKTTVVVGIISACMTKDITQKCYGPFLYTSVWKNRDFVNCAINKEMAAPCGILRSSKTQIIETVYNWPKQSAKQDKLRNPITKSLARKANGLPIFRAWATTTPKPRQPCVRGMFIRLETLRPCIWYP